VIIVVNLLQVGIVMKKYNLISAVTIINVSSILFLSIASYSQKQTKCPAESEPPNKHFTTIQEVWTTPFKSQGKTSTCWSFSTTSFLESEVHRLKMGDFEISQMHTVYYAYLEKARRHIQSHTENPFSQGGLPHDVTYLLEKYGAVPRSYYIGNKDIENKYDHREMFKAISGMLIGISAAGKDAPLNGQFIDGQLRWHWFDGLKNLLDTYIGKPPDSIMVNGKTMTPHQFAMEVLNLHLHDYIEIISYSNFPFYSTDELLLPDNWLHYNKFYNVPLDDFMRIIDHSLENGFFIMHRSSCHF
jgi:bleomycin hydrolase